jgi:hypothetical protein
MVKGKEPSRKSSRIPKRPAVSSPPKTRKKPPAKKQKPVEKTREESIDPSCDEYAEITDPALVTCPVNSCILPVNSDAWTVVSGNPMWFIFDSYSPARNFKRGMPFDENKDFPIYNKVSCDDLTETDDNPIMLMPFAPMAYKYVDESPSSASSV